MSLPAALELAGVGVVLGGRALLENVSFEVPAGVAVGVIGESGAGKTTLLRTLVALGPPATGCVRLDGVALNSIAGAALRSWRRALSLVSQDPVASFDPRLKVRDSLADAWRAGPGGGPQAASREAIDQALDEALDEALDRVRLQASHAQRYPHQLSVGQCQRAQLARALLCQPRVLLLDEVTSALDASLRAQLATLLAAIRDGGTALVCVSHDLEFVERLCSVVHVLDSGRIVESGTLADIYTRPACAYTRRLLDARLPLDPPAARARLRAAALTRVPD